MSANRSVIPSMNSMVAYIPMETLGSPCSTFNSDRRLIIALSDIVTVEILLRFRASLMSEPNFLSARLTGSGKVFEDLDSIMCIIIPVAEYNVYYDAQYFNSKQKYQGSAGIWPIVVMANSGQS